MRRSSIVKIALVVLAIITATAVVGRAENIDVVTLPVREGVQLTIYNNEDLTLVRETRSITLKRGANRLQFSWTNTLIDPSSVEFRAVDHKDEVTLVDTLFLGSKPQHLIWNIESKYEGQVKVEVCYFTSGISWAMDYTAIANPDETTLNLRGYVSVTNNSGEDYENADIRLIVGNINLMEKIAELARRQGLQIPRVLLNYNDLKLKATRDAFERAKSTPPPGTSFPARSGLPDASAQRPKEIIKEGVSEYFMFSIEGSETVTNRYTKRMQAVKADSVSFDTVYRMRNHQYGPRPVRFFIFSNDTEHKLGDSPLPNGMIRTFRDNGRDGLAFLGAEYLEYVPVRSKIELNLGADDLVVFESLVSDLKRSDFGHDIYDSVVSWDELTTWISMVKNYRSKPITFELRQQWSGDTEYKSDLPASLFDYMTVETIFTVESRDVKKLHSYVLQHLGKASKQNRVLLKK